MIIFGENNIKNYWRKHEDPIPSDRLQVGDLVKLNPKRAKEWTMMNSTVPQYIADGLSFNDKLTIEMSTFDGKVLWVSLYDVSGTYPDWALEKI